MKIFWILLVSIQFAFPAFENSFKFQYLADYSPKLPDTLPKTPVEKSFAFIVPFSQPFLSLTTLKYSRFINKTNYKLYLCSSGDKLYRETMVENQVDVPLHSNYRMAGLLNAYVISIKNYSTHYALSAGLVLTYYIPGQISYRIKFNNGFYLFGKDLKRDIPEILHISLTQQVNRNRFTFSLLKDMLYPVDFQFNWKNEIIPGLGIDCGIIHSSGELMIGTQFKIKTVSPSIFMLIHPDLGVSYGIRISY